MKQFSLFIAVIFSLTSQLQAKTFYWVGPQNGSWSSAANWSLTGLSGSGGAGIPGLADDAHFAYVTTNQATSVVKLDAFAFVNNLNVGVNTKVTLYTSINTTFYMVGAMSVTGSLTDSTSEDVKFNFLISGSATASIKPANDVVRASWIFSGRVPVSSGNGAMFSAGANARVTVSKGGVIISRNNAGAISSLTSSLEFKAGSHYVLENNLVAYIPAATWSEKRFLSAYMYDYEPAAEIQINGNAKILQHLGKPKYGSISINLNQLSADFNLDLPDSTDISDSLSINSSNSRTINLLKGTGPTSLVSVKIGHQYGNMYSYCGIYINGLSTKVALAHAPASATALSYRLNTLIFEQKGGNFSLLDGDYFYTGSSTLAVRADLKQTAGSFITNCIASNPQAKYAVEILGPLTYSTKSGAQFPGQTISMSSGSIDNNAHSVTLRMAQVPFSYQQYPNFPTQMSPIGIKLAMPLHVGRLELFGGPISTTAANFLEVDNGAVSSVQLTGINSYVDGPVRRLTNYAGPVMFPTGKGTGTIFHLDSCVIIPSETSSSMYQAEYFGNGYASQTVTAPFKGVANNKYWNITKLQGADAKVKLSLNGPVPGSAATDRLIAAHFVNGSWVNEQGSVLSPGNVSTGSVTTKLLSTYGVFTFGYGNVVITFTNPGFPLSVNSAANADMQLVSAKEQTATFMKLAPTIVAANATLSVQSPNGGRLELLITDVTGRSWKRVVVQASAGTFATPLVLGDLPRGTYQVSGFLDGKALEVARFMRQ